VEAQSTVEALAAANLDPGEIVCAKRQTKAAAAAKRGRHRYPRLDQETARIRLRQLLVLLSAEQAYQRA